MGDFLKKIPALQCRVAEPLFFSQNDIHKKKQNEELIDLSKQFGLYQSTINFLLVRQAHLGEDIF